MTPRRSFLRLLRLGWQPSRAALRWELQRRFDADFGVLGTQDERGCEERGRAGYAPSDWVRTWWLLRRLRLGPEDVLVDVGAGRGLVVLLASELRVRRVIGVELVDSLAEAARRNVERNRERLRAGDVEIARTDALSWGVPQDLSLVYLYNSFFGETFRTFIERLFASWEDHPRPLRLVYRFPWEHNWLVSTGRVTVLDVQCGPWPPRPRWWLAPDVIVTYGVGDGPFPAPRGRSPRDRALRRWASANDTRFELERPGRPPFLASPQEHG